MCQGKCSRERKPNIRKEIDRRIDAALSKTDVIIERVLLELHWIKIKAQSEGCHSVAIRCLELQGKYPQMWTYKVERPQTIDKESTDELLRLVKKLATTGGLDLIRLLPSD